MRTASRWWRRRSVLAAATVAMVLTGAWVLAFSPLFTARRVQVTGLSRLAAGEVLAAAAVPRGTPLLRLDSAAVRRRVAQLPPVADVAVRRVWPATITLRVTERQAAAVLSRGESVVLVDRTGVTFAEEPTAPAGVPVLDVASADPHDPATAAALTVVGQLPAALRGQVRSVAAPSPASVTVRLTGGTTVVWGDTRDAERKAAALAALLRARPASRYDVSTPDVVTTR